MFRYNFDRVHRSVTDWRTKSLKRTVETASYWKWLKSKMVNHFEKQICLGTGISFLFLSLLIMVPNGIVLVALYKNPLHCFRRPFSIFLKFIPAVDFLTGIIVCSGQALTRLLCAFSDGSIPREAFFATLQLSSISVGVYRVIDQHLNTTFPLCVTTLCYLGIFFALRRKSSRVGFETRRTIPSSGTVQDTRQAKRAQM